MKKLILGLAFSVLLIGLGHTQSVKYSQTVIGFFDIRAIVARTTTTGNFRWTARPAKDSAQVAILAELRKAKEIQSIRFINPNELLIERYSDHDWMEIFPKVRAVFGQYVAEKNEMVIFQAWPDYGPSAPGPSPGK